MCSLDDPKDDAVVDFVGGSSPRILRKGMITGSTVLYVGHVMYGHHM